MMVSKVFFVFVLVFALSFEASAESGLSKKEAIDVKAADLVLSKSLFLTKISKDGSYSSTEKKYFKVQNESGRTKAGLREEIYDPSSTSLKITSAYTVNGGKKTKVDLSKVIERSVSDKPSGINNFRKKIIPFNNVKVGSTVVYQTKIRVKKPLVPGVAFLNYQYGVDFPERDSVVKIISEKPIKHAVFDKHSRLEFVHRKDEGKYVLLIKTIDTVFPGPSLRKKAMIESGDFPVVMVTTASSWTELATHLSEKYERAISEPLPKILLDIVKSAKKKKSDHLKISYVLQKVTSLIAYSGNWVDQNRMFFPRGHKEVVNEAKGDCKDFATTIAGVMRALGFEAKVALVRADTPANRLYRDDPIEKFVPSVNYFNHAVTYVKSRDGSVYWLDGTRNSNITSGVWGSLAEEPALILGGKVANFIKLPEESSDGNESYLKRTVSLISAEKAEWKGHVRLNGSSVSELQEQIKVFGKEKLAPLLGAAFIGDMATKETNVQMDSGAFSSTRKRYDLQFNVIGKNPLTSLKKDQFGLLKIPANRTLFSYFAASEMTGVYLGSPTNTVIETEINGVGVKDVIDGDCFVVSPWLDYERTVDQKTNSVLIKEVYRNKKSKITSQEGGSKKYQNFVGAFKRCLVESNLQAYLDHQKPKDQEEGLSDVKMLPVAAESFEKMMDIFENRSVGSEYNYVSKKGLRIFSKRLESNPKDLIAKTLRARAIARLGYHNSNEFNDSFYQHAMNILNEVINENPKLAIAYDKRHRLHMAYRNHDLALRDSIAAYKIDGKNLRYMNQIAVSYAKLNKKKLSLDWLEAVRIRSKTKEEKLNFYGSATSLYAKFGEKEKELDAYVQLAKLNPESPWAASNLAQAYLSSGKIDLAHKEIKRSLEIMEFGVGRSTLGSIQYALARRRFEQLGPDSGYFDKEYENQLIEANKNSRESGETYSDIINLYYQRARIKQDSEAIDRADVFLAAAKKIDSRRAKFLDLEEKIQDLKQKFIDQSAKIGKKPAGRWVANFVKGRIVSGKRKVTSVRREPILKMLKADELIFDIWWPKGSEVTYQNEKAMQINLKEGGNIADVSWPKGTNFRVMPVPGGGSMFLVILDESAKFKDLPLPKKTIVTIKSGSILRVIVNEDVQSKWGNLPKLSILDFENNKIKSILLKSDSKIEGKDYKAGNIVLVSEK